MQKYYRWKNRHTGSVVMKFCISKFMYKCPVWVSMKQESSIHFHSFIHSFRHFMYSSIPDAEIETLTITELMGETLHTLVVVATTPTFWKFNIIRLWRDVVRMELLTTKYNPNDFQTAPPLTELDLFSNWHFYWLTLPSRDQVGLGKRWCALRNVDVWRPSHAGKKYTYQGQN